MIVKKINLQFAELTIQEEHVIRLKLSEDVDIEKKDAEEVINSLNTLTEGRPYGLLTETLDNLTATDEAPSYMAKVIGTTTIIANAVCLRSLSVRLLINMYIRFHVPTVITKIFNSEKLALDWLENQRQEYESKQKA
jgi:hypothetical protein